MQAETLAKAQQNIGETMGNLGLAFMKLGKFETEETTCSSQRIRAAEIKKFATAALKASRLNRGFNANIVKYLVYLKVSDHETQKAKKMKFSLKFFVYLLYVFVTQ